jgi:hypothetical protein
MLPALRHFIEARAKALSHGYITENGGAIHSVERILNILSLRLCYPHISHQNSLKTCPNTHLSVAAHAARLAGPKVEIEHVLPQRSFTNLVCDMVEQGATDADVVDYIKDNFRLVLFTPEERRLLDRVNRSRIVEDSLKGAGIELYKG